MGTVGEVVSMWCKSRVPTFEQHPWLEPADLLDQGSQGGACQQAVPMVLSTTRSRVSSTRSGLSALPDVGGGLRECTVE